MKTHGGILLLFLMCPLVLGQSGTHFVFENRVYASYSSWVISYSLELTPYVQHLNTIKEEISLFEQNIQPLIQRPVRNVSLLSKTRFMRDQIANVLQEEVKTFWNEFDTLHSLISEVSLFTQEVQPPLSADRRKRSLIPFVGRALSLLFGVSTEKNVHHLRDSLIQLGDRQEQVVDVLSHSLTLLNKTNAEVQLNRKALLRVMNATSTLQQEFRNLYNELTLNIFPNFLYVHSVARLQGIFNIISATLQQTHLAITNLLFQIQSSAQGKLSPSFIPPSQLVSVLSEVQTDLPPGIHLPYELNRDGLVQYYRNIQPMMITGPRSFHLVMAIPLIHARTEYDIYRTVQVPVPHPQGALGALNILETEYFAISRDHNHFINLKEAEILHCLHGPICKFTTPKLNVGKYPQCIISLYLHDNNRIKTYCSERIIKLSDIPYLEFLFENHWLISTSNPFSLEKQCGGQKETLKIGGVFVLKIETGCSATSEYFDIPLQVAGETHAEKEIKFYAKLEIIKLSPNIWNQSENLKAIFSDSKFNLSDIRQELLNVEDVPLQYLHNLLRHPKSTHIPIKTVSVPAWKERSITFGTLFTILVSIFFMWILFRQKWLCFKRKQENAQVTYVPYDRPDRSIEIKMPEPKSKPATPTSVENAPGSTVGL